MEPILQIQNVNYIYSIGTPFEHQALDNVSFSVNRGEFVGTSDGVAFNLLSYI